MGKITQFEIVSTDNRAEYRPGELVTGQCIVELKDEMQVKALQISLHGEAYVRWSETRGSGKNRRTYTYRATEKYFDWSQNLFGQDQSEVTLPAGRHGFNFSVELPRDGLLASFKGAHGRISYWLNAEIKKPFPFINKTICKDLTIVSAADVNINDPEYKMPVEGSNEKTLCCCLCKSGPLSVTARTDRKGYCPGEAIAVSAEFENHSSRTVVPYATLFQCQMYFAQGHKKSSTIQISEFRGEPLPPGGSSSWNAQQLKIPTEVHPTIANCNIMKVEYFVKVGLDIPRAFGLFVDLPIAIGNASQQYVDPRVQPSGISYVQYPPVMSQYYGNPTAPPPVPQYYMNPTAPPVTQYYMNPTAPPVTQYYGNHEALPPVNEVPPTR